MSPFSWTFRMQFLAGFAACVAILGYAISTQLNDGLEPCPLCIFQRLAYAALALVFFVGGVHAPRSPNGRRFYGALVVLASLVGIGIAGRHVWLQLQPPGTAACGVPFSFMRETMGPMELVRKVLTGSGDCGTIDWTLFGLSMPAWSLIGLVLLCAWGLRAAFQRRRGRTRA